MPPPTGMSAARPSTVPPTRALPLGLPVTAPLPVVAPLPAGDGGSIAIVGALAGAGAWPSWFASYGTAAVLHAVSIPAAPRTPAPSSTQRLVAQWSCWDSSVICRPSLVVAVSTLLRQGDRPALVTVNHVRTR